MNLVVSPPPMTVAAEAATGLLFSGAKPANAIELNSLRHSAAKVQSIGKLCLDSLGRGRDLKRYCLRRSPRGGVWVRQHGDYEFRGAEEGHQSIVLNFRRYEPAVTNVGLTLLSGNAPSIAQMEEHYGDDAFLGIWLAGGVMEREIEMYLRRS